MRPAFTPDALEEAASVVVITEARVVRGHGGRSVTVSVILESVPR